ncbi:4-hydroxybutyrate CoA-transferase [Anaerosolibacter carboniphilus]|uniref:4-hydroxybutyrate CoA-transferase n=1 Tax=Anaerosolibacter carboniphilus TaxID=1417629 RepID=A0A841KZR1_9FIRM|nr:hypothetical protein [Anaerosolibacter carboniphilus]MBB6217460.1 4-hydroxybutyrate CoA-transferase [Anaerosolibacter carboniphilus]
MKIGIKYCGGCNPRFDRLQFIGRLKNNMEEDVGFEKAEEECIYDFLLIVGGCTQCCAEHGRLKSRHGKAYIRSQQDYGEIVQQLNAVKNAIS